MKIPEEKIEEVRSASDIVDIISAYVRLKRRGKSYVGLCPFHKEKTPSFHVTPDKQMFYCFGCHEGGNVFSFVMKTEKVSFIEAVRTLANRAGIELPMADSAQTGSTQNEQLFRANMLAARFYFNSLTQTSEGGFALEYLRKRGFTDDTIKRFGLGYAPRSWQALINYAVDQGVGSEYLEIAGLAAKRDDGGLYDRFRGRVIFPIFSTTGRVVAFGGRQLYDDDTPMNAGAKYINTPETPIYQKGKLLYGLSMTRDEIRKQEYAILVEGYTDLISLYQAGILNVVATSGTSLTEDQIRLLGRYARTVVIVYDADSAGSAAALRGVELILEKGLDVKVTQLPEGEDPDSFVRTQGRGTFIDLIDEGISFIDYKASELQKQGLFASPEGQARAVRSIIETLSKIPDELKRNFYIKAIAERYDIYESTLHRELEVLIRRERSRPQSSGPPKGTVEPVKSPQVSDGSEKTENPVELFSSAERDLLKLLLQSDKEIMEFILSQVSTDELGHPAARILFEALSEQYRKAGVCDASMLINDEKFSDYTSVITSLLSEKYEVSDRWQELRGFEEFSADMQHSIDAVRTLKKWNIRNRIEEVRKNMREMERQGDNTLMLARDLQILQQELKLLDKHYSSTAKRPI
jgi:DNA primase